MLNISSTLFRFKMKNWNTKW